MDYNLLLITTLEQKGCSAAIVNGRFDDIDTDGKVLSGTRVGTSYLIRFEIFENTIYPKILISPPSKPLLLERIASTASVPEHIGYEEA